MLMLLGVEGGLQTWQHPDEVLEAQRRISVVHVQGRVVSGHNEALQQVQRMAVAEGAMKVAPLAVSGAFHTSLMKTAQDNLKQAMLSVCFMTCCLHDVSCALDLASS